MSFMLNKNSRLKDYKSIRNKENLCKHVITVEFD